MKTITLTDLGTAKKVIRYMQKEIKNTPSYKNPEGKTTYNMLTVLIKYADDLAVEIRKNNQGVINE